MDHQPRRRPHAGRPVDDDGPQAPYTHFLDPGNHNFGPFYDAAALPWNATLDARTMEIIDSEVGGLEDAKTLLANVDQFLAELN